ncbi:hypothetical protein FOA43_000434 [Brettanomyces nanus]|uniref:Uncharacterized protein n=1 Tax=Eeniella nana TaxID=13502 RepID=A0A875RZP7_EENNA|nr:uncharacterized protein FOA43_000434 [Brettanomyces nanus]QPG73129.1 hypothetical protein FOA43_000434 [Brettanomyces nanus]
MQSPITTYRHSISGDGISDTTTGSPSSVNLSKDDKLTKSEIEETTKNLELIHDLKFFLLTAPVNWHENQVIRRYYLNKEEGFVSCVYWNNLYFITGTDIVRSVAYKLELFGRKIVDRKKLEEGIFSDLRALKCGTSAILEMPKSPFLRFLHRNQCLRTQKKQKVFFWFSVPHDKLFQDALARDLERGLSSLPSATVPSTKLLKRFKYDHTEALVPQLESHILAQTGKSFSYILSESSPEETQAVFAKQEKAAAEASVTTTTTTADNTANVRNSEEEESSMLSFSDSSPGSSSDNDAGFPLDYIQNDSFLFNVDGVGSVTECNGGAMAAGSAAVTDFTYTQNPSSAFLPDFPSLWLVSPTVGGVPDDLLLDQATPVVPMFGAASRSPITATTPRSLYFKNTGFGNKATALGGDVPFSGGLASPGFAMFTTLGNFESVNETTVQQQETGHDVAEAQDKPIKSFSFVPSASSLTNNGLATNADDVSTEDNGNLKPQIITIPPGTGIFDAASLSGQMFSPVIGSSVEPNLYYYYGASPYFADFPVLPFSRPLSGIKSTFDGGAGNGIGKSNERVNGKTKGEIGKTESGRIGKPKRKGLLNPSLRHLELDIQEQTDNESQPTNKGEVRLKLEHGVAM